MPYIGAGLTRFNTADELTVTGDAEFNANANFGDNDKAQFGAGNDLQIYHDGSHSFVVDTGTGGLQLRGSTFVALQGTNGENGVLVTENGSAQLRYNNSPKLETTGTGVDVTGTVTMDGGSTSADFSFGDNDKAQFGAGSDLQIFHDGNNSHIKDSGTGNLNISASNQLKVLSADGGATGAIFNGYGAVELYHNNSKKMETSSTGIDVTGTVTMDGGSTSADFSFGDNDKALFGAGDDLQIFHDGTDSVIKDKGTGNLVLTSNGGGIFFRNDAETETYANFNNNGSVQLRYDNGAKLETTSTGVTVTGTALATTNTDTTNTGSVTLDFGANQNFVLTLTGNVTLANPSTEQVGQSGFIIFIQDSTGSRTVSLGTDYETAGGAGLTLSTAASSVDIVPYVVQSAGNILLGAPQLAFS